jgi:hypothetical protein
MDFTTNNMERLTKSEQNYLRGYANALQDLMFKLTGDNTCSKSYDPIDFGDDAIHSYAFNFKNGGRRHPLKDFENIEEVKLLMLEEAHSWIDNELTVPHGHVSAILFEALRVRLENMEAKIKAWNAETTKSINQ